MQRSVDDFLAKGHIPKESILMFMTDADHVSNADHVQHPMFVRSSASPNSIDKSCKLCLDTDDGRTSLVNSQPYNQDSLADNQLNNCIDEPSVWSMHARTDFHSHGVGGLYQPFLINRIQEDQLENVEFAAVLQAAPNTFSVNVFPEETSCPEVDVAANRPGEEGYCKASGSIGKAGAVGSNEHRKAGNTLGGVADNGCAVQEASAQRPASTPHTNGGHPFPVEPRAAEAVPTAVGAAEPSAIGRRRRRESAGLPPPAPAAPATSATPAAEAPDEASDPGAARELRRREQNREAQRRFRERTRYREFHAFSRRLAAAGPGIIAAALPHAGATAGPLMPAAPAGRPAWKPDPSPPLAMFPWAAAVAAAPAHGFPPPALRAASGPRSFPLMPGPYWCP
jgi:hypothetical protein